MAIAFDAASSAFTGSGSSLTFSHTTSGSNRLLVVGFSIDNSGLTVSSVTYAGSNLTLIRNQLNSGTGTRTFMYYIVAPATGANDIVITISSAAGINAGGISLTDAKQTGIPDAENGATGTSTNPTVSVTTVADTTMMIATCRGNIADTSVTAGTGYTKRYGVTNASSVSENGETQRFTSAGAKTVDMNFSVSRAWTIVGASFVEEVAPVTFIPKAIIF